MILINGNFLCRNLTGIERFAFETCRNLDEILDCRVKPGNDTNEKEIEIALLVPANAKSVPDFKKIKIIKSQKAIKSFPFWDLWTFARECKKLKATALDFSNTAPTGKTCGIAFLHDIYASSHPEDFVSLKDKLIKLYSKFSYHNITKNAKLVITVSDFSKSEIKKFYKVPDEKIKVIPNGWDHFKNVQADEKIFEKFPQLKDCRVKPGNDTKIKSGSDITLKSDNEIKIAKTDNDKNAERYNFYFTLGSLSKRKNLKWIASYAENHSGETFAVSGKAISGLVPPELESLKNLKNVILLGYVTDGEVKALMQKCKAFVFPSYYEGFGIPPLEALSCGAKIIVANAASLPEIYGKTAHYINPFDTNCDLDEILKEKVEPPDAILEKFTYKNAAEKLLQCIIHN